MRRVPKLCKPSLRAGGLLERRLEVLEVRFPSPQPVNVIDKIIGLAKKYVTNDDFNLLAALVEEAAAGKPREMSDAETRASAAFEAALKLECRRAGVCSLKQFERLLDADHNNRPMKRA